MYINIPNTYTVYNKYIIPEVEGKLSSWLSAGLRVATGSRLSVARSIAAVRALTSTSLPVMFIGGYTRVIILCQPALEPAPKNIY